MDLISYILSKKYADKLFAGGGAAKGKNCTIQSIEEIEGGNRVTFQWTLDDGTVQTDTLDVMNGAPGEQGPKGDKGDQGEAGPAGANGQDGRDGVDGQDGAPGIDGKDGKDGVNGQDGADGVGIVSIEKTQTVGLVDIYTITFTNGETSNFNVTNGASGASTAEDVEYDNSNTHLESTNVQDAINEIANSSSSNANVKAIYEESPSAAAHSVGDYIYYNSHLYRVIVAIAIGDTLVVDTNIKLASEIEEGTEVFIENLPGESSGGGGSSAGLPEGGTTGQVLTKNSNESGDASWQTPAEPEIPEIDYSILKGGEQGQVLSKRTNSNLDIEWVDQKETPRYNFNSHARISFIPEHTWKDCKWYTSRQICGKFVWTDGKDVYYNDNSAFSSLVLNKKTGVWEKKIWQGISDSYLSGQYIFTYEGEIYYSGSRGEHAAKLNKETGVWTSKNFSVDGWLTWTDGKDLYYSEYDPYTKESIHKIFDKTNETWIEKVWETPDIDEFRLDGRYVWTDGENTYFSYYDPYPRIFSHYVFNKETKVWSEKEWNVNVSGDEIWTDGENIYCNGSYILNKKEGKWEKFNFGGNASIFGEEIWTDGEYIHCSTESSSFILDRITNTWIPERWKIPFTENFYSYEIWSDGKDIYLSRNEEYGKWNYRLDRLTRTWEKEDLFSIDDSLYYTKEGKNVWTDGKDIYYSLYNDRDEQLVLNKITGVWEIKNWVGGDFFGGPYEGENVWTDGENFYYNYNNSTFNHYVLNKEKGSWEPKKWNGLPSEMEYFEGKNIWSDGNNIYFSAGDYQLILNKDTDTWTEKTWNIGEDSSYMHGIDIWTDNENIYYSDYDRQYVLNKETKEWETKEWTGLSDFCGQNIWLDGETVYYSNGENNHYVLNKETSKWEVKEWSGLSDFCGTDIWTDGKDIHNITYSYENDYVLNRETNTWVAKKWKTQEYHYIDPRNVWSDGFNIYYVGGTSFSSDRKIYIFNRKTKTWLKTSFEGMESSDMQVSELWTDGEGNLYYSNTLVLDRATNEWKPKTWSGEINNFSAEYIWTDGEFIYYSYDNETQFVLNKETETWETKTWEGFIPNGECIWTDGKDIIHSNGTYDYVLNKKTGIWEEKQNYWKGFSYQNGGDGVWTDGMNIYYSRGSDLQKICSSPVDKVY